MPLQITVLSIVLGMIAFSVNAVPQVFNKFPGGSSFNFECNSSPTNWYFTPDGGTQTSNLPSNIAKSGLTLTFLSVTSSHEGLYSCTVGEVTETQFNLTVLALAKFANCPSNSMSCDTDLQYSYNEGQSISVDIEYDYFGGGNRNVKQNINFVFLRDPSNTLIVSCPGGSSCVSTMTNRISFPTVESNRIEISISNATNDDAGEYKALLEVATAGNLVNTITSLFTVNVMSTTAMPSLSTSSSISILTTSTATDVTSSSSTLAISESSSFSTTSISTTVTGIAVSTVVESSTIASSSYSKATITTSYSTTALPIVPSMPPNQANSEETDEGLDTNHIATIVVVTILVVVIVFVFILVAGMCILARKRNGSRSLSITYMISIFRREKSKAQEYEAPQYCTISTRCSTSAEIIATDGELYAKLTMSRSQHRTLSDDINSPAICV